MNNNDRDATSTSDARALAEDVALLRARIATLESQLVECARKPTPRKHRLGKHRLVAVLGVAIAVTSLAGVATSQEDDCDSALPFCFASGEPARATEVNQNFKKLAVGQAELENDLDSKLDQDSAGNVEITGQLGLGIYLKDCGAELDATEAGDPTDCHCADGEMALSGGGWGVAGESVLRESRQGTSNPNLWRLTCTELATGDNVTCEGMKVVCANLANVN